MSLVFMPCHKSHIDYLVVSHILYCIGVALPHIAAGGFIIAHIKDNLNLPGIGSLLSYNGAFFIRRQWGDDKLYIAVMKEYIEAF
jgi:glycerol-3-phosphate O-acyltransferase